MYLCMFLHKRDKKLLDDNTLHVIFCIYRHLTIEIKLNSTFPSQNTFILFTSEERGHFGENASSISKTLKSRLYVRYQFRARKEQIYWKRSRIFSNCDSFHRCLVLFVYARGNCSVYDERTAKYLVISILNR